MNLPSILLKNFKISPSVFFTWSSGIKSPFYCDNRLLLSSVEDRSIVVEAFIQEVKRHQPDIVAGVATSAIPYAAIVADRLQLPMIYVRNNIKDHGTKKLIEGSFKPHQRVVLLEDLISTGASVLKAAKALIDNELDLLHIISIFNYELPMAMDNFMAAEIDCTSLCTFDQLLNEAFAQKVISEEDRAIIEDWRSNYALSTI